MSFREIQSVKAAESRVDLHKRVGVNPPHEHLTSESTQETFPTRGRERRGDKQVHLFLCPCLTSGDLLWKKTRQIKTTNIGDDVVRTKINTQTAAERKMTSTFT